MGNLNKFTGLIIIPVIMCLAISIILVISFFANDQYNHKNDFKRYFMGSLKTINAMKNSDTCIGISGISSDFYFLQTKNPQKLIAINPSLTAVNTKRILIESNNRLSSRFHIYANFPNIFVFAGNEPSINICKFENGVSYIKRKLPFFTREAIITPNSFLLRGIDVSNKNDQVFMKVSPSSEILQIEKGISENREDAGISTDGLLHYDTLTHLLLYVSFYRNQFLCLDTNIQLIYKGHTIDTLSTYQTNAGSLYKKNSLTFTNVTPSRFVNLESCVEKGHLYINSQVKADNELAREFQKNSVIDVYNIKDGKYLKSFYIPFYKSEKLFKFKVFESKVLVLYKSNIVTYQF